MTIVPSAGPSTPGLNVTPIVELARLPSVNAALPELMAKPLPALPSASSTRRMARSEYPALRIVISCSRL